MNDKSITFSKKLIYISAFIALFYFALKYAIPFIAVLTLSLLLSACVVFVSQRLSKKLRISEKLLSLIIISLFFVIIGGGLILCVIRIVGECEDLLIWLSANRGAINDHFIKLLSLWRNILEKIPLLDKESDIGIYAEAMLSSALDHLISFAIKQIGALFSELIRMTPMLFMSVIAFIMSCFYLTADREKIAGWLKNILTIELQKSFLKTSKRLSKAFISYARSYLIIFILTFFEALLGLLVIRAPFAFLMSLIIALVDILPIFGSGTVLVPWSIFCIISGKYGMGLSLLILYGIITLIRQIAEPRIIGAQLGLHPFITVCAMLLGMCAFGVGGAIFAPMAVLLIKELFFYKN